MYAYNVHMSSIRIDVAARKPVYEQIADELRARLLAGEIRPGARLPSVRSLAIDLGIHHNTVAQAYRAIAEEGWVELTRGRGATVLDRARPKPAGRRVRQGFERELTAWIARARGEGVGVDWLRALLERQAAELEGGGE